MADEGDATMMVVLVASKVESAMMESAGVKRMTGADPAVRIVMSNEVMSVVGSCVPVAPFVVIVPETVYPFWIMGKFSKS
jgi:hypothetical protein